MTQRKKFLIVVLLFLVAVSSDSANNCHSVTENPHFVKHEDGSCVCKDGFAGSAVSNDKCRCDAYLLWNQGTPVCTSANICFEKSHCSRFAEREQFVNCINGKCVCKPGFDGSATDKDLCRCTGNLVWLEGEASCMTKPNTSYRKLTALEIASQYSNSDYVVKLQDPTTFIVTPGGNVSYMNLTSLPTLAGRNLAAAWTMLEPCGLILPHVHPRGDKTVISIDGQQLMVGYIWENKAKFVVNILGVGDATFVPKGAIHFLQNLSCNRTNSINGYNYEDPGLLILGSNLFRFPDDVLGAAFGLSEAEVDTVRDSIPPYPLYLAAECRQRCGFYSDEYY
eukprot:TRINITY_DN1354_c0_g1_i4.p1 TRINITY_DN1354_c0_g1~~TRINITY_DN1354_c0_g1_i4.p1  ORF type:complete len:347 (-),score=36.07 TRINITY_DN1354_c0_g1_i4:124-1134(-)